MLVAVAGLPMKILDPFTQRLAGDHRNLRILAAQPLRSPATYSPEYLDQLYGRIVRGFRRAPEAARHGRWGLNFVLLFLDRGSTPLIERFGLEALLAPINPEGIRLVVKTASQVNRSVNMLSAYSRRLLHSARQVLATVTHEVTVRDNKTCMLLPRANYGATFDPVPECVQGAVLGGRGGAGLLEALRQLDRRLEKNSNGHFKGKGGLVFEAPAKAGARHGMAPDWDARGHQDRCVIRGHLRFGAPFEPNFHYDCKLRAGRPREFVSCHGTTTLKRGRAHVNIAPNDNIR